MNRLCKIYNFYSIIFYIILRRDLDRNKIIRKLNFGIFLFEINYNVVFFFICMVDSYNIVYVSIFIRINDL